MSFSTSSFINTPRAGKSSMSRYDKAPSVGASGIGRLSLQQNDSDDEMVAETRSKAKKGESSRSKDKGKTKAGPSGKSRDDPRKSRKTTSKGERKRPSDDDDDDDDDSSSSEEDEEPEPSRQDHIRMWMSVLNVEQLSPVEFNDYPSESFVLDQTKILRGYADSMAVHLNQAGVEAIRRRNPPTGHTWGSMVHDNLNRRKASHQQRFTAGDIDSIETIAQFDRIYASIRHLLVRRVYAEMHINAKRNLAFMLVDILNFMIREVRPTPGLEYAGNKHERNIYKRFIYEPGVSHRYLGTLVNLARVRGVDDLLKETRVKNSLLDTWNCVTHYIKSTPAGTPQSTALGNLRDMLALLLRRLSMSIPVPHQ